MISSALIKKYAADAGFDLCGLAPCRAMDRSESRFRAWLGAGRQARLGYLERNLDKRFDPRRLVEGARTAVVCGVCYKNRFSEGYPPECETKIASYALFPDYHGLIKSMLGSLLTRLAEAYPGLRGRCFTDTAPLLEKELAVEAGLGWIGRQSLLITPRFGPFVLLGELLLTDACDLFDAPFEGSRCGRCYNCVESCPAGALPGDRMIDARRCISCKTVERAAGERMELHGWIFGCDACASCCPFGRKAPMHTNPLFDPLFDPLQIGRDEWLQMDEEEFARRFGSTPLMRSGLQAIQEHLR